MRGACLVITWVLGALTGTAVCHHWYAADHLQAPACEETTEAAARREALILELLVEDEGCREQRAHLLNTLSDLVQACGYGAGFDDRGT